MRCSTSGSCGTAPACSARTSGSTSGRRTSSASSSTSASRSRTAPRSPRVPGTRCVISWPRSAKPPRRTRHPVPPPAGRGGGRNRGGGRRGRPRARSTAGRRDRRAVARPWSGGHTRLSRSRGPSRPARAGMGAMVDRAGPRQAQSASHGAEQTRARKGPAPKTLARCAAGYSGSDGTPTTVCARCPSTLGWWRSRGAGDRPRRGFSEPSGVRPGPGSAPGGVSAEADYAAQRATGPHVVVAGVDLVEGVRARAQLVELEVPAAVQLEHAGDVGPRVGRPEQ